MRPRTVRVLLGALALAVLLSNARPGFAGAPLIPPEEMIPVSKISRGMRGYGLTVFQGTRVERFDVQVIDILRNDYMGQDMLLIRMHGGPVTTRGANIIAGMSGSPIYLGGRLAGAVSMGWTFPREPVAIVTPIAAMAEAFDPRLPQKPLLTSAWDAAGAEPAALLPFPGTGRDDADALTTRRSLMTPLYTHGLSPIGVRKLSRLVSSYGLEAAAGAGGRAPVADIPLQAGSGLGVYLVTGDIEIGGSGTLTYRKGNRILGFGHPMLQIGAADLPMATIYVHDVACLVSRSFKLTSMAKVVGSITQDRPFSIAGTVGRMPQMVPVEIGVRDAVTGRSQFLRVRVVNHPMLTARFIQAAAGEGLLRVRDYPGESMARVQLQVEAEGLPPIVRKNTAFDYFDPNGFDYPALRELGDVLQILSGNPFGQVPIRRVRLYVTIQPGRKTAAIERVSVDRDRVEPGEKVRVSAVLRPWQGTPEVRTLDVTVPARAPEGRAFLAVSGGAASLPQRPSLSGGFFILGGFRSGPGEPASSVAQMVSRWLEREHNDELAVRLLLPSPSLNLRGQRLLGLPGPLADVIRSSKSTGSVSMLEEVKSRIPIGHVVTGVQVIPITVQRRSLSEKHRPTPSPPPQPSPPPPLPPELQGRPVGIPHDASDSETPLPLARVPPAEGKASPTSAPPAPVPQPGPVPAPGAGRPAPPPSSGPPPGPRKRPGRQTIFWAQRSFQDWERGEARGTAVTTAGTVCLAPSLAPVHLLPEENMVWALAAGPKGDLYLGTGIEGRIYHRSPDGKMRVLFDAPEPAIQALALDVKGNLYAGTAQGGIVYRTTPDGKTSVFFRTGERYVLSLATDAQGGVYAGTGGAGRVYRISPDGKGAVYYTTPEPHVLRLAVDGKGSLIAGTADGGVVYRITAEGKGVALLDTGDKAVGGLAVDGDGRVLAATAPRGLLFREGRAGPIHEAKAPILALALSPDGALYAGAGAGLLRITGEETAARIEYRDQGQILALAAEKSGRVYAATGNAAGLYALEGPGTEGSFESVVRDVEVPARWGRLSWEAELPAGASVVLQTRTGNTAEPDASWSPWSAECTAPGAPVPSPTARFVQYRILLRAGKDAAPPIPPNLGGGWGGAASPEVKSVTLSYLPENRAPEVEWKSPLVGSALSGKPTLTWSGNDPDRDTVAYELFYSGDGGGTWKQMQPAGPEKSPSTPPQGTSGTTPPTGKEGGAPAPAAGAAPAKPAAPTTPAPAAGAAPAKPAADPAKGGSAPPEKARPSPPTPPKPGPVTATSFRWDTEGLPDGAYLVKIVASDERSNPGDARTAERIVGPLLVTNAKPKLIIIRSTLACDAEGRVTFRGRVEDPKVPIASISYRVDGGDWLAATPADGMLDSQTEEFVVSTRPLEPGKHAIEVEATNLAEGTATETVEVK